MPKNPGSSGDAVELFLARLGPPRWLKGGVGWADSIWQPCLTITCVHPSLPAAGTRVRVYGELMCPTPPAA